MSEMVGNTPAIDTALSDAGEGAGERGSLDDTTWVRLSNGPLMGPVLRRVVSIVLARADWPLNSLDDALLVCDALGAHAPAHAQAGKVALSVRANGREAELCVKELTRHGAAQLVRDARLPVVGNVLERIAESVSVELEEPDGSQLVLVLTS